MCVLRSPMRPVPVSIHRDCLPSLFYHPCFGRFALYSEADKSVPRIHLLLLLACLLLVPFITIYRSPVLAIQL